ncbi:MAG: SRPBCC family protein [Actinomycetota bacterium]
MDVAFDVSQSTNRPRAEVWEALVDWSLMPTWMPAVRSVVGPDDLAVGEPLHVDTTRGARVSTISALDEGHLIELTARSGPITACYRYALDDAADGTTSIRLVAEVAVRGPMRVVAPLVRRSIRRADGDQLDAFVRVISARR